MTEINLSNTSAYIDELINTMYFSLFLLQIMLDQMRMCSVLTFGKM